MGASKSNKRFRRAAFRKRRLYGNRYTNNTVEPNDIHEIQQDTPNVDEGRPGQSTSSSFQLFQLSDENESSFITPKKQKLSTKTKYGNDDAKADGEEDNYFVLAHFGVLKEI